MEMEYWSSSSFPSLYQSVSGCCFPKDGIGETGRKEGVSVDGSYQVLLPFVYQTWKWHCHWQYRYKIVQYRVMTML